MGQGRLPPSSAKSPASSTQSAFHQQVPPPLTRLSPRCAGRAPTPVFGSSPRQELPICVHAPTRRSARPNRSSAIRRREWATYRLPASATVGSSSTPASSPTFGDPGGKPPSPNGDAPFGTSSAGLSQAGGHLAFHRVDPHLGDRSPRWIYPALTGPSTPCRETVPCPPWNAAEQGGPAVGASFEQSRREPLGFHPWLKGPSHALARESSPARPHPRCLRSPMPPGREAGFGGPSAEAATRLARRLCYRLLLLFLIRTSSLPARAPRGLLDQRPASGLPQRHLGRLRSNQFVG